MAKQGTKTVVPKLRFPGFRDAGVWEDEKLSFLVDTVAPPVKLPSSAYLVTGKFPVIDQSQDSICGWTDNEAALVTEPLPLIVFGDHTCVLKFVERPFAQGADGIKILSAKAAISVEYLFHSLNHQPVVMEDYKRHFSTLKERRVFFPSIHSGEQQKIADCLTSLDEVIAAQGCKVDALKAHKRGLMQQLFPREGETRPRLRFAEFRDAPEWVIQPFDNLVMKSFYGTSSSTSETGQYPVLRMGNMVDGSLNFSNLVYLDLDPESFESFRLLRGDILLNRTNSLALVGKISMFDQDIDCITASYIVTYRLDKERVNPAFCNLMLNTPQYQARINALARPSVSQANINPTTFRKELLVPVPRLAEQQRIADCLASLDTRITAETHQLAALKTHKQGLMQQLFPVLEGP